MASGVQRNLVLGWLFMRFTGSWKCTVFDAFQEGEAPGEPPVKGRLARSLALPAQLYFRLRGRSRAG